MDSKVVLHKTRCLEGGRHQHRPSGEGVDRVTSLRVGEWVVGYSGRQSGESNKTLTPKGENEPVTGSVVVHGSIPVVTHLNGLGSRTIKDPLVSRHGRTS